jgi:hypothetical protein
MSDPLHCDNCGAVGYRKLSRIAPAGWLYVEIAGDLYGEDAGETYYIYACSEACTKLRWKVGPGFLSPITPEPAADTVAPVLSAR